MSEFKYVRKEKKKIKLDINSDIIDELILLVFSTSNKINNKLLRKMKDLLSILDTSEIQYDEILDGKLFVLNSILKGLLDLNITNYNQLKEFILSTGNHLEVATKIIEHIENEEYELSDSEIEYIDSWISDRLQFSFIYSDQEDMEDLLLRFKNSDFDSLTDYLNEYAEFINASYRNINKAKAGSKFQELDYKSNSISCLRDQINRTVFLAKRPNNKLKTGIQLKNKMLNGGYECGRFHLFVGLPGAGKSTELLNVVLEIKKFNKEFLTKDSTKKPLILVISQENSQEETLERIISHYTDGDYDMKELSESDIEDILFQNGFTTGIDIEFIYRPSKSISTLDVRDMIIEKEAEGFEVVLLVHDYLKRIKSSERYPDLYMELGQVVDDFCNIAKEFSIPVISAMQFNREAFSKIEKALESGKADVAKNLSSNNIGESIRVVDNSDVVIAIAKESTPDDTEYITYKLLKFRGKRNVENIDYFAHPMSSGMRYVHDVHLTESKSKLSLADGLSNSNMNSSKTQPVKKIGSIKKKLSDIIKAD